MWLKLEKKTIGFVDESYLSEMQQRCTEERCLEELFIEKAVCFISRALPQQRHVTKGGGMAGNTPN